MGEFQRSFFLFFSLSSLFFACLCVCQISVIVSRSLVIARSTLRRFRSV